MSSIILVILGCNAAQPDLESPLESAVGTLAERCSLYVSAAILRLEQTHTSSFLDLLSPSKHTAVTDCSTSVISHSGLFFQSAWQSVIFSIVLRSIRLIPCLPVYPDRLEFQCHALFFLANIRKVCSFGALVMRGPVLMLPSAASQSRYSFTEEVTQPEPFVLELNKDLSTAEDVLGRILSPVKRRYVYDPIRMCACVIMAHPEHSLHRMRSRGCLVSFLFEGLSHLMVIAALRELSRVPDPSITKQARNSILLHRVVAPDNAELSTTGRQNTASKLLRATTKPEQHIDDQEGVCYLISVAFTARPLTLARCTASGTVF